MNLRLLYFVFCVLSYRFSSAQRLVSEGKTITASSTFWDIGRAVDGNTDRGADRCKCCAATNEEEDPWYKLDLGQQYKIYSISVLGRGEHRDPGYGHTLKNMQIKLGTTELDGQEITHYRGNDYTYNYTLPTPQDGRYISLTLRGMTQSFIICELSVYAVCDGNTYGPDCVNTCGNCKNGETCDTVDGECPDCATGYKSPLCQDCIVGRYGSDCQGICGYCAGRAPCNTGDGTCLYCKSGYRPPFCKDCIDGRFRSDCHGICGKCENNAPCNKGNGTCLRCKTGYRPPYCQACDHSYFGNVCTQRCYCLNSQCDVTTGICPSGGCAEGYKGNTCSTPCDKGKFGEKCANSCGNCYQQDTCDAVTGLCTHNCSAGYTGTYCKEACPVGKFGRNCIFSCGNCLNNTICSRFDGSCDAGCELGYKPPFCQQENAEYKARCPEVKSYQLATAVVGTVAVVAIIGNVVAAICYMNHHRRKHREGPIQSQPDISNPYELANRGAFETEHQYGQTAPVYEEPEAPYEIPK